MSWPASPDFGDVRYGPHLQSRLDVYLNPTGTDTGGNVCLLFIHGGGWAGGTKVEFTVAGANGFALPDYVLTSGLTTKRWNVISIDYRTFAYSAPLKMSYPSTIFDGIEDAQRAVQWIKDNARLYGTDPVADPRSYGINPNKIVIYGYSAGATNGAICAFARSRPFFRATGGIRRRFEYGSSSIPALLINHVGVIDVRFDAAENAESFPETAFPSMFGTSSTDGGTEWEAISHDMKSAASPLAYLEQDSMEARPAGVYNVYHSTTPTGKPYANIHAAEQAPIFDAALEAALIDRATETVANGTWDDYTPTPETSPSYALSARVVAFCEARLAS